MADPFSRAKHLLLDRAMRDGRLTAASRLVFYEIIQHVNRVSGDAWPSEARLANRLQIDVKTVKRALPALKLCGYIEVNRNGRHNTYRPLFNGPPNGDKLSPIDQAAPGDNLSKDRGQTVPSTRDKNGPVTSLREPHQNICSKNTIIDTSARGRAREGCPSERGDPLASKPDDGGIHLMLIQELGSHVIDALYTIDGGRPLKLLTMQRRQRHLTSIEVAHARSLAAGKLKARPP